MALLFVPPFSSSFLCRFTHPPLSSVQPVFNMAEYHQLFVGTERLRVPEILFQPSLTGEEQMGLMETLEYVLSR